MGAVGGRGGGVWVGSPLYLRKYESYDNESYCIDSSFEDISFEVRKGQKLKKKKPKNCRSKDTNRVYKKLTFVDLARFNVFK